MFLRYRWVFATLAALLFLPPTTFAGFIDPATLFIGNPPAAGDPNQIGNTGLVVINQNSGGAPTLNQPVLLVLGIPNVGTNFFANKNPITSVVSSNGGTTSSTLGGASVYSGVWNSTTGYATNGPMTASNTEAYSILGVDPPTTNSNNWTNWSTTDLAIDGITATKFALYVFQINADLVSKGTISVQFPTSGKGALPLGTFVIAYGQSATKTWSTPFTEAGLTTNGPPPPPPNVGTVPEPASLVLLGLGGILSLGSLGLNRRRQKAIA